MNWVDGFDMKDDGLNAFMAIQKLNAIEFEFTIKGEGWIGRISSILES